MHMQNVRQDLHDACVACEECRSGQTALRPMLLSLSPLLICGTAAVAMACGILCAHAP
jgi:hypothetical protein